MNTTGLQLTAYGELVMKAVVPEIAVARIRLPRDVEEQINDAYRRRRLARIRATTRTTPTPVNNVHKQARRPAVAKENPVMSKQSKAEKAAAKSIRKKSLKGQRAKTAARRSFVGVVAKAEGDAARELRQLEKQIAESGGGQEAWGAAFQVHRARANAMAYERIRKAAQPAPDPFDAYNRYLEHPQAAEQAASRAAASRAVASAQGQAINHHLGGGPKDQIASIINDDGKSEPLATYEVQTQRLAKALNAALDEKGPEAAQRAAQLSYQVTRRQLRASHYRGEI